jgi:regulator of cell morphogenesis and NO signaling
MIKFEIITVPKGIYHNRKRNRREYMDIKETIKDIADNHHGFLKQELPVIKSLAYKILKVHYEDCKDELIQVHRQYGRVQNELELALVKKQMVLLPMIWDYQKEPSKELLEAIRETVREVEGDNQILLKELEGLKDKTNTYTMPESGCPTYDTTYKKMEKLHREVEKYIKIEREMYKVLLG